MRDKMRQKLRIYFIMLLVLLPFLFSSMDSDLFAVNAPSLAQSAGEETGNRVREIAAGETLGPVTVRLSDGRLPEESDSISLARTLSGENAAREQNAGRTLLGRFVGGLVDDGAVCLCDLPHGDTAVRLSHDRSVAEYMLHP